MNTARSSTAKFARGIGLPLDEFVRRVNAGEIDWDHPEAFALAGLVASATAV